MKPHVCFHCFTYSIYTLRLSSCDCVVGSTRCSHTNLYAALLAVADALSQLEMLWVYFLQFLKSIVLIIALSALSGCSEDSDNETKTFVQTIQETTEVQEPEGSSLPDHQGDTAHYTSHSLRNPFDSLTLSNVSTVMGDSTLRLDPERPRELLESYPLESLRMVGYIEKNANFWGILVDPNNSIHRVMVGNYLGHNEGKIEKIHAKGMEIRESSRLEEGKFQDKIIFLPLTVRES